MAKPDALELGRTVQTAAPGACVGWLVAWTRESGPVVDFPGNNGLPIPARTTIAVDESTAERAVQIRQGVLLLFERDQPDLPIVVGLIQPASAVVVAVPEIPQTAEVDGKRVEIEGKDEIVLRCGLASITLRANGRVVIRGTCVETRASGTNRIKGGSVQIN